MKKDQAEHETMFSPLHESIPWLYWWSLMIEINSYSASHDNWCTGKLLNRIMTAQWEGMGM